MAAELADPRLVALRQGEDEAVGGGGFGGLDHFGFGGAGATAQDVFGHGAIEQEGILTDKGDAIIERGGGDGGEIVPVDQDAALLWQPEAEQEIEQGGFAAAGQADQSGDAAGGNRQADAVQHGLCRIIPEGDLLEPDGAEAWRERRGIGLVAQIGHAVDQLVEHADADGGSCEREMQAGEAAGRICHHQEGGDEGEELAGCGAIIDDAPAAIENNARDREAAQRIDKRHGAGLHGGHAVGEVLDGGDSVSHAGAHRLLEPERLDDADAVDCLLHGADNAGHGAHLAGEQLAHLAQQAGDRRKHQRHADERDKGEDDILREHDDEQAHNGEQIAPERGGDEVEGAGGGIGIIGDAGDEIGRFGALEKRHILRQDGLENPLLGAGDNVVADAGEQHLLPVSGEALGGIEHEHRAADEHHGGGIALEKHLVDEILHEPGAECCGRGGDGHEH